MMSLLMGCFRKAAHSFFADNIVATHIESGRSPTILFENSLQNLPFFEGCESWLLYLHNRVVGIYCLG